MPLNADEAATLAKLTLLDLVLRSSTDANFRQSVTESGFLQDFTFGDVLQQPLMVRRRLDLAIGVGPKASQMIRKAVLDACADYAPDIWAESSPPARKEARLARKTTDDPGRIDLGRLRALWDDAVPDPEPVPEIDTEMPTP